MESRTETRATCDYLLFDQKGCFSIDGGDVPAIFVDTESPSCGGWSTIKTKADEVSVASIQGRVRLTQLLGTDDGFLMRPFRPEDKKKFDSDSAYYQFLYKHEPYPFFDLTIENDRNKDLFKFALNRFGTVAECVKRVLHTTVVDGVWRAYSLNEDTTNNEWYTMLNMTYIDLQEASRLISKDAKHEDIVKYAIYFASQEGDLATLACKFCDERNDLITLQAYSPQGLITTQREIIGPKQSVFQVPTKNCGGYVGARVLSVYHTDHDVKTTRLMTDCIRHRDRLSTSNCCLVHHVDSKKKGVHNHVQIYELDPFHLQFGQEQVKVNTLVMDLLVRAMNVIRRGYNALRLDSHFSERDPASIPVPLATVIKVIQDIKSQDIELILSLWIAIAGSMTYPPELYSTIQAACPNGMKSPDDATIWKVLTSKQIRPILDSDYVRMIRLFTFGCLKQYEPVVLLTQKGSLQCNNYYPHHRSIQYISGGFAVRIKRVEKKVDAKQIEEKKPAQEAVKPLPTPPKKVPLFAKVSSARIEIPKKSPIEDEL